MNYPLISEYIDAITFAEDNFAELSYLKPVLGDDGLPVMTSGNFAVVFKMKDERDGKCYAVKCFTKEQEGRAEAYREITKELENVSSPYLISVRYFDKELFVDTGQTTETEFPVLLMDWVEGKTLDKYLRENLDDKYALEMLAYRFSLLAQWLIPQPFAHGDLKPDNILVREDGSLVLVDYDGMYVPAMKGQKARELGSPDFRHPQRTEDDFDEHIDDFPLVSILVSLKAISIDKTLLHKFGASDRLLFSQKDYREISKCNLFKCLFPSEDVELNSLFIAITIFFLNNRQNSFHDYITLDYPKEKIWKEELGDNGHVRYWMEYSSDKKRLIRYVEDHYFEREYKHNHDFNTFVSVIEEYGALQKYNILDGTEEICDNAFILCRGLKELDLPETLKLIGKGAFSGCEELKKLIIPSSVEILKGNPFSHIETCSGVASRSIKEGRFKVVVKSNNFRLESGVLFSNDRTLLFAFLSNHINQYNIPETVRIIKAGAFECCEELTSVFIPSSVKEIEREAFARCYELKDITIPTSVKTIGANAFNNCWNLECVIINNPDVWIESNAFSECKALSTIQIPHGTKKRFTDLLPNISSAFIEQNEDGSLGTYVTDEDLENAWTDEFGVMYSLDRTRLLKAPENIETYTIQNGTKVICDYAFSDSELQYLYVPCTVARIGSFAFECCYSLKEVKIPSSIKIIGKGAFCNCQELSNISIPDSVITIEESAFQGCSCISRIKIPRNVQYIGNAAFADCKSLIKLSVHPQNPTYDSRNECNAIIETKLNKLISGCKATVIHESVTAVGEYAFLAIDIKNLIIPSLVSYIDKNAFLSCSCLANIVVDEHNPFFDSRNACNAIIHTESNTLILGCKATIVPYSVTCIGENAFYGCTGLVKIELPSSVNAIGSSAFEGCANIKSIYLPNSITSIKDHAFFGCENLTKIEIPPKVKLIEDATFSTCSSLESVVLPDSIMHIKKSAFASCYSIKNLKIPKWVNSIGDNAFCSCWGLESINIPGFVATIGHDVFKECSRLRQIIVPKGEIKRFSMYLPHYANLLVEA